MRVSNNQVYILACAWLAHILCNALTYALFVRSHPGTINFVLSVYCCVGFLASLCYHQYLCLYSCMGELTVCIVFPTVAIRMHRLSPLVPLDIPLTAAACLSSACSQCHKPVI